MRDYCYYFFCIISLFPALIGALDVLILWGNRSNHTFSEKCLLSSMILPFAGINGIVIGVVSFLTHVFFNFNNMTFENNIFEVTIQSIWWGAQVASISGIFGNICRTSLLIFSQSMYDLYMAVGIICYTISIIMMFRCGFGCGMSCFENYFENRTKNEIKNKATDKVEVTADNVGINDV